MRLCARLLLVALVLAPWSPVTGCPMAGATAMASVGITPADAPSEACCCDDGATDGGQSAGDEESCCASPKALDPAEEGHSAPCCTANDAPAPFVPAPALVAPLPVGPSAIVVPEPWFAAAVIDDAAPRISATESPPGGDALAALSSTRLRL